MFCETRKEKSNLLQTFFEILIVYVVISQKIYHVSGKRFLSATHFW